MKVSVAVAVYYNYETEIPDDATRKDLSWMCDLQDPVYQNIIKVLREAELDYDADTISIVREDTNEIIYNL